MSTKVERIGDDLQITRTFNAKRPRVFEAWTHPEQVQAWWGCGQARSVVSSVDLRVGGEYRHVMDIEGAGECVMVGIFTEVVVPERFVYTVAGDTMGDLEVPDTTTTVEFIEAGSQTTVRLTVQGLTEPLKEIVTGGWSSALAKLAERMDETARAVS